MRFLNIDRDCWSPNFVKQMLSFSEYEDSVKDPKVFDELEGESIRHTKIGVWDIYEDIRPKRRFSISHAVILQKLDESLLSLPYVWQSIKTLISLSSSLLFVYSLCSILASLVPAVNLYYSGLLLQVVQTSIETRHVDRTVLFRVIFFRVGCATLDRLCHAGQGWTSMRISSKMRAYYSEHILQAHIRLDVPTFNDPSVRGQLDAATSYKASSAWSGIKMLIGIVLAIVQSVSQIVVLVTALRSQPDGILLACVSFVVPFLSWLRRTGGLKGGGIVTLSLNPNLCPYSVQYGQQRVVI